MTLKEIVKHTATQFVDVRTVAEFNTGHINGAVNIPLQDFAQRYNEINELGKTPVVFYCRSGNRSGQAVAYLQQMGIENIYNGGALEEVAYNLN